MTSSPANTPPPAPTIPFYRLLRGLFVVRTALEDRTLQAELAGYREYVARVRYRLLPRIW